MQQIGHNRGSTSLLLEKISPLLLNMKSMIQLPLHHQNCQWAPSRRLLQNSVRFPLRRSLLKHSFQPLMQTETRAIQGKYWSASIISHLDFTFCPRGFITLLLIYVFHWCMYQLYQFVIRTYYLLICRMKTLYALWASFYYVTIYIFGYVYEYVVGLYIENNTAPMINSNTLTYDGTICNCTPYQFWIPSTSRGNSTQILYHE